MDKSGTPAISGRDREPWEPPTVKAVGKLSEIVQQGKPSMAAGDPGEPMKNTQHG
jgi:hypothetical protein